VSVRANATAVGAFVLGAIAIAIGVVVVFGSGAFFRDAKRYVIFFDGSLEGLSVGAPVKYRGVQIGTVATVSRVSRTGARRWTPWSSRGCARGSISRA
jgi:paraquat-inducible protein B